MDENSHKDNLEEFFRKSFEKQKNMPPQDDWDLPSNNIWEGISDRITDRERKVYFFQNWKYWALATLALLMIVFYQFWTYQYHFTQLAEQFTKHIEVVDDLKKELENEHIKIKNLEEKIESENLNNNSKSIDTPLNQSIKNELITLKKIIENSPKTNFLNTEGLGEINTSSDEENQDSDKPIFQKDVALSIFKKEDWNTSDPVKEKAVKTAIPISNIAKLSNEISFVNLENESLLNVPILKISKKEKHRLFSYEKWSVDAYGSPLLAKRNLKKKKKDITRPVGETDESNPSFDLGINLNYHLNKKWSLFGGVSYQNLNLLAENRMKFDYTEVDATLNEDNNMVSDYDLTVETSFGDLEVEMRVANEVENDGLDYMEGDKITAKIRSNLNLENIGLVVGIGRYFDIGRWSIGLDLAAISNFNVSKSLALTGVSFPKNRLVLESSNITVKKKLLKHVQNMTFDAQLGIGVHYNITPKIQIQMKPTYRMNLTPFFESKRVESRISSWGLQTGIAYQF